MILWHIYEPVASSNMAVKIRWNFTALPVFPLHAKFLRANKNIYLHFMLLFHIDMTQVVEILTQVR